MSGRKKAQKFIRECRLIFTTCSDTWFGLLREKFSVVNDDDALQQTEPVLLVPLVKDCQRVVLVGDHMQLCETILEHAILQQYDVSLFERLYRRHRQPPELDRSFCRVMLDTQCRMYEDVCTLSSAGVYEGKLLACVAPNKRPLPV